MASDFQSAKFFSPTVSHTLPGTAESSMMGFSGQQSYRSLRSKGLSHQLQESIKEDTGSKCGERELRGRCVCFEGVVLEDQARKAWLYSGENGKEHWSFISGFLTWMELCFGKGSLAWWPDLGADTRWQSQQLGEYCSHLDKKLRWCDPGILYLGRAI